MAATMASGTSTIGMMTIAKIKKPLRWGLCSRVETYLPPPESWKFHYIYNIQYTVYFIPYSVYIIFFGNSVNSPYFSFVPPSFYPEKHCHCSPAILNTYAKTIHLFFHCCNTKAYIHQKIFCLLMIKKRVCLFRHTRFVYHLISVWKSSSEERYGWIPDDLL